MIDERHKDFFKVLGYLTTPSRITKLDIETHPYNRADLEARYLNLAGVPLIEDSVNYYVWGHGVNKWGSELRIYFRRNNNIPKDLESMVVSPRFPNSPFNARINNNDFVWLLIKYGFRATNSQDDAQIRSRIPLPHNKEFELGYGL
jgi:hypothetical protein